MILWMDEVAEGGDGKSLIADNTGLMKEAAELCLALEGIGPSLSHGVAVSLSFVDMDEIRELNSRYRDVDAATDVLSFPMTEGAEEIRMMAEAAEELPEAAVEEGENTVVIGDVVICTDMIIKQAKEYGHSERRELIYLFVHSMLHLLGYDHMDEDEKKLMRSREEEIMAELGVNYE